MIVVDASVLVAALADDGADAEWAAGQMATSPLAAPAHAPFEAANVLRRLAAAGALSPAEATLAHADLCDLRIDLHPYVSVAQRTWDLRANVTVYDAAYVALAEALDVPLVTLDDRLSRAPGIDAVIHTPPR